MELEQDKSRTVVGLFIGTEHEPGTESVIQYQNKMYHILVSRSVPVPSIVPGPIRPSLVKLSSNMIVDIKFFKNK